jgi:ribulose-phosphate 3-epimerase
MPPAPVDEPQGLGYKPVHVSTLVFEAMEPMSSSPPRPVLIAPSILSADFARLAEEVSAVEAEGADWVHVDVMDGHFVPNITIGMPVVESLRRVTKLPLDVHLMIENADRYVEAFAKAGADGISVHVEASPHLHRTVQLIRAAGARPGVVLNPATPASSIEPILPDVDLVLVMTVNPGFGGQRFIRSALDKVARIRAMIDRGGFAVDLQVDGGIGPETIAEARQAGANVFVAGSAIFNSPDYGEAIRTLRSVAESARNGSDGA